MRGTHAAITLGRITAWRLGCEEGWSGAAVQRCGAPLLPAASRCHVPCALTALGRWQAVEEGRAACWPRAPTTAPSASGTCSTWAARTAAAHCKVKMPTADMSFAGVCLLS